jgi:hypothetical protein
VHDVSCLNIFYIWAESEENTAENLQKINNMGSDIPNDILQSIE